jgi:hypothetical protein
VHVSDGRQYLGNVLANDEGAFAFRADGLAVGSHNLVITAMAPWPDQVEGPPTLLRWDANSQAPPTQTIGRWLKQAPRSGAESKSSRPSA